MSDETSKDGGTTPSTDTAAQDAGSRTLEERVSDARVLISYLAQADLDLPPEQVAYLIESCRIPPQDWDAEREARFWLDFNALAKAVRPATVESILANQRPRDLSPEEVKQRAAERHKTITSYSRIALASIVVVLLVQIYWVIGSNAIERMNEVSARLDAIQTEEGELESRILSADAALSRALDRAAQGPEQQGDDLDVYLARQELEQLSGFEKARLEARWEEAYDQFKVVDWTLGFTTFGLPGFLLSEKGGGPGASSVDKQGFQVKLEFQTIANSIVVQYILPLLLGFLGANVYVLRQLLAAVRKKAFLPESSVAFQLRLYLGMISGLTFAWLFAWIIPGPEVTGFGAVSPLAVAFLVGYSVELLFSILDRAIAAIDRRGGVGGGKALDNQGQPPA